MSRVSGPSHSDGQVGTDVRWRDRFVALGLGAAFVGILVLTADMGFTRDEGYYFHAAYDYLGWLKELAGNLANWELGSSLEQANIDRYFAYNQEHPVLPKCLFALSYWLFHETLGWVGPSLAMRLPGMLSAGVLVYLIYTFCSEAFGRWQAVVAVVAMAAMPRPFFHAHLACFDYPIVLLWFFVMVANG